MNKKVSKSSKILGTLITSIFFGRFSIMLKGYMSFQTNISQKFCRTLITHVFSTIFITRWITSMNSSIERRNIFQSLMHKKPTDVTLGHVKKCGKMGLKLQLESRCIFSKKRQLIVVGSNFFWILTFV